MKYILVRWAEYFENLLNVDWSAVLDHIKPIPTWQKHVTIIEPPTLAEVVQAITEHKNKKPVDVDNISGELWNYKYGGEQIPSHIWQSFTAQQLLS